MLGGLFSRWVDSAHHSREKWLVNGMPSPMIKRSKIKSKIITNKTPPGLLLVWTVPRCFGWPWSVIVGGGGVKSLPFCLGTAYNVGSMEDIVNSWLLCWQWDHTSQNYLSLFQNQALAPLQIPASLCKGLSFTLCLLLYARVKVIFTFPFLILSFGKHFVLGWSWYIYPIGCKLAWTIIVDITQRWIRWEATL